MSIFVCGTDTGAGKTYTAAALLYRYRNIPDIRYWKPVQTGTSREPMDREVVQMLTGLGDDFFVPTRDFFKEPLSPHRAAELEGRSISVGNLMREFGSLNSRFNLVIESAGGLMVPLNRKETWVDFLKASGLPVVVAARSGLGTINHSLLTIKELRAQNIPILGISFGGDDNPDNRRTVCEFAGLTDPGPFDFKDKKDFERFDPSGAFENSLTRRSIQV